MFRAFNFDQGEELVYFQTRLLLLGVSQQIWQDGLVVTYVGAERNGDSFALSFFGKTCRQKIGQEQIEMIEFPDTYDLGQGVYLTIVLFLSYLHS